MVGVGFVATQASTGLLVLIGLAVVFVRPRTRTSVAFGATAMGVGVGVFMTNAIVAFGAALSDLEYGLAVTTFGLAFAVVNVGAWRILVEFPHPLPAAERRLLLIPGLLAVFGAVGGFLAPQQPRFQAMTGVIGARSFALSAGWAIEVAGLAALMGAAAVFGLRYAAASAPNERRQFALMGSGWAAWLAAAGGAYLLSPVDGLRAFGFFAMGGTLITLAAWLWATRRPEAAGARNVCLLISGAGLGGLAVGVTAGSRSIDDTGFFGLTRLVSFAIFGYAILRHQLLGFDVKVRWTLSKGTVAGIIVAVFLVGSQLVENVTNDRFGLWGGAVLAGLALFALGPLQGWADRLAGRLIPMPVGTSAAREATFSEAVRMALRGGITRREELTLAALARDLGLDAYRSMELRGAAERAQARRRAR